jgi:hypothetical protein
MSILIVHAFIQDELRKAAGIPLNSEIRPAVSFIRAAKRSALLSRAGPSSMARTISEFEENSAKERVISGSPRSRSERSTLSSRPKRVEVLSLARSSSHALIRSGELGLQAANIIRLGQVEKLDKAVPRRKVQENHQILCNTVLPIPES